MLQYYIMHAFSISADILLNKLPLKNYIHFNFKDLFFVLPIYNLLWLIFVVLRGVKEAENPLRIAKISNLNN